VAPILKCMLECETAETPSSGKTAIRRLGGRFDYVSVSDSEAEKVERYAILIMSNAGSLVKEVEMPRV
jgi:hypothetical protein